MAASSKLVILGAALSRRTERMTKHLRVVGLLSVFAALAPSYSYGVPLTIATPVSSTGGISLVGDPITIAAPVTAAADVILTAPDTALPGDNVILNPFAVTSTAGNIRFFVGDDLTLAAGSLVSANNGAISIMLDVGDADAAFGSTVTLAGELSAQQATILGGSGFDTIVFQGPTAFVTFTGAQSGTISLPGVTHFTFTGIENITGNVIFVAAAPEPASLALMSIGLAGLGFSRRKRTKNRFPAMPGDVNECELLTAVQ